MRTNHSFADALAVRLFVIDGVWTDLRKLLADFGHVNEMGTQFKAIRERFNEEIDRIFALKQAAI